MVSGVGGEGLGGDVGRGMGGVRWLDWKQQTEADQSVEPQVYVNQTLSRSIAFLEHLLIPIPPYNFRLTRSWLCQ